MTFEALRKYAVKTYYPALFIERSIPHKRFVRIRRIISLITLVTFFAAVYAYFAVHLQDSATVDFFAPKSYGVFFIVFSLWLLTAALQAFYYSYYFRGLPEMNKPVNVLFGFELAHILYLSHEQDLLKGFLHTRQGKAMMTRAGITHRMWGKYLEQKTNVIDPNNLNLSQEAQYIASRDYIGALYDADPQFAAFLLSHEIQKKDFIAIAEWVIEREVALRTKEKWWSRDRMGRIPGIGKNWSYGRTFNLEKYSHELPFITPQEYEVHAPYGAKELEEIESILVKSRESNALLVSDDAEECLTIVSKLNHMIDEGTIFPQLEHKRMLSLDTEVMIASKPNKIDFEQEFITVMNEADAAGNIILVIEHFPSFISSCLAINVNAIELIDPYLTSPNLQIIAFADPQSFHQGIENNPALMRRFEKVVLEHVDDLNALRILQNEIIGLEKQTGLFFTYPALVAIIDCAERYFPDALMPDKAIDVLNELVPKVLMQKRRIVRKEHVMDLVQTKTGIPVGTIKDDEREKLLALETILHKRIVGQDEAIDAIAGALRRARSGINNPNRPIGSFLFLGPTGVGKTETTKALAEVFFGAEAKIERLDMSEFAGPDALPKLIGSFGSNQIGILSTLVREHPYGVLLLDEFEKTTPDVLNLFLQILDEGFFSDMEGKKVNTRNLLIIATSNAGSELIWDAVKQGNDLSHAKEIITDAIIKAQIFKPELLNRFDGVIIFHPLGKEHLEKIAQLQLEKLKARLAARGMNLVINADLINYVVSTGTDPKFGARPMYRAIQDKVEQLVADKMLRGALKPGSEIVLTQAELAA